MTRKPRHVPVSLNPLPVDHLPEKDIRTILRGTDELIMSGGRTLLAKILKGSREKKILERELNHSPVHGAFRELSLAEITARIDWLIVNDYLDIEYDYRLPLLVYTRRGWAIEREIYTDELVQYINEWLNGVKFTPDIGWLNDKNREVLLLVLARIEESQDPKYLPFLKIWAAGSSQKLARQIRAVIGKLR